MVTNHMKTSWKILSLSFDFLSLGYGMGILRVAGCFGGWDVSARMKYRINTVMRLTVKCTNVQGGPPNPYRLTVFYLTLKCPVRTCQFCWGVCEYITSSTYILQTFVKSQLLLHVGVNPLSLCVCICVCAYCLPFRTDLRMLFQFLNFNWI